jgi:glycogen debranching enzyme
MLGAWLVHRPPVPASGAPLTAEVRVGPDPAPGLPAPAPSRGRERRQPPHRGSVTVTGGPELITINHGSTFLVCGLDSSIHSEKGQHQGLYSDDTRFLSAHSLRLNSRPLEVVASSRLSFRHARWTLMPSELLSVGGSVSDVSVSVTLDRMVSSRRLHEDITVTGYGEHPVQLMLMLHLASDFADVFEVRQQRWQRRASLTTTWTTDHRRLESFYSRRDFVRRCMVRTPGDVALTYANGELHFPVDLAPRQPWHVCLQYDLVTDRRARPRLTPCPLVAHVEDRAEGLRRRWHQTVARARPGDPRLMQAYEQAVEDFAALRLYDHDFSEDVWLPAAGVPWFVAVFGRDSLIASLQAMPLHPLFAIGTLQKLAAWQSEGDDPVRDAEPGKICHEMRVGEWAHFRTIPHSPYYGTADATALYLMLLADAHRWLGNDQLERFRDTAIRCLDWIDRYGDRDGDGLQEYAPRAPGGYRNQCWRDAEDGVLDEDGGFPPHPIGTCEMQAYVVAAKASVAALFDAWGDGERAQRLRDEAEEMRRRFIDAYWLEEDGTLAFALDGDKRPLRTATSNPGHCLWLGMLDRSRGRRVARRLMQPDLYTGWGLRVLSSDHPAYDPHAYQRGSVWPHDTMLAAAGLRRYGMVDDFWRVVDGMLDAVSAFERTQMPELFAGLERRDPDVPVPYRRANVPQAWAAGTIFHAVRLLLGLQPDVPDGRLYVDPLLPPWCPTLEVSNLRLGGERYIIRAWRTSDGGTDVDVRAAAGGGALTVVRGAPPWMDLPTR